MPVTANIRLDIAGRLDKVTATIIDAQTPILREFLLQLTNGTGASQIDRIFGQRRSLTTGANENLDLNGVLLDANGDAFTLARLKLLYLAAVAGNTTSLTLSRPATNGVPLFDAASDAITIGPGGAIFLVRPDATAWVVTAATADLLNVANSAGATANYDVILAGASV